MTRKIIFIIIGALLFLALLFILWFWLLHRAPSADNTQAKSGFGTSTDKTAAATDNTQSEAGSYQVTQDSTGVYAIDPTGTFGTLASGDYIVNTRAGGRLGSYRVTSTGAGHYTITSLDTTTSTTLPQGLYVFVLLAVNRSGSGTPTNNGSGTTPTDTGSGPIVETNTPPPNTTTSGPTNTNLGGINSGAWVGSDVATRDFTPAQINQINDTSGISGTPLISVTPQSASLGTSGLILGLAAAGCAAQWALNELSGTADATAKGAASLGGGFVLVYDFNAYSKLSSNKFKSIQDCLVKTIAQAAIDQITRSVVTWINSGFNGQPSFVTNFNQYFANVADQAAGEFIKGSALSFLCSPFAPQIKIAIAQSYANRNAATCSLTKITNNINGFLRGAWGNGGWASLIQFTTVPTNNPYGAYAYAQIGLQGQVASAQNNANRNVSPGGFISLQRKSCLEVPSNSAPATPAGGTVTANGMQNGMTNYTVCQNVVTTPGDVIESSLKTSLAAPIQGLNLAQDINSIINALTNQVMIKALYGGLGSSLGVTNPLAPAIDQSASAQAQNLLAQLQSALGYAGQYANVEQGSIADIENSQAGLNTAFNCWNAVAASKNVSTDVQARATANAATDDTAQKAFDARISPYNDQITRANSTLATIQNLQSQILLAATPEDVASAANLIAQGNAQGVFLSQADVTTAQQDRTTLQTELTARNQQTSADLAQCRAIHI
jgi:hypothetical protein